MGHFRDQMEQAMLVRGFSPVTRYTYSYWMRRFVAFFKRPPIDLGLEEISRFQHALAADDGPSGIELEMRRGLTARAA